MISNDDLAVGTISGGHLVPLVGVQNQIDTEKI
jgi:hypothetical protein